MKKQLFASLVLAGVAGGLVWNGLAHGDNNNKPAAGAQAKPAGVQKIALIDMERVINEATQFQKHREELQQLHQSKASQLQELEQQKNQILSGIRGQEMEFDSEEYVSSEEELIRIDTSAKTLKAVAQQQIKRRMLDLNWEMYTTIQKALDKFADANGYAMVLHSHRYDAENEDMAEFQKSAGQQVIWERNKDDITDTLITFLNERYEASQQVKPASASGAGTKAKASTAGGSNGGTKTAPQTSGQGKPAGGTPANGNGANKAAPKKNK